MISPTHVRATDLRRQDLLAHAAQSRMIENATAVMRSTPTGPSARWVRPIVRRAFAPLAALAGLV